MNANDIWLMSHISIINDQRIDRTKKHSLVDILAIAIFSVIVHAESSHKIVYLCNNGKPALHMVTGMAAESKLAFWQVASRKNTANPKRYLSFSNC